MQYLVSSGDSYLPYASASEDKEGDKAGYARQQATEKHHCHSMM